MTFRVSCKLALWPPVKIFSWLLWKWKHAFPAQDVGRILRNFLLKLKWATLTRKMSLMANVTLMKWVQCIVLLIYAPHFTRNALVSIGITCISTFRRYKIPKYIHEIWGTLHLRSWCPHQWLLWIRLSPRARSRGFPPATMTVSPSYFHRKQQENRAKSTS